MPPGPILSAHAFNSLSRTNFQNWQKNTFALIDSGATDHIINDLNLLIDFHPLASPLRVTVGDGTKLAVLGYGTLVLQHKQHTVLFPHTLYVPGLKCNVLSVSKLGKAGYVTVCDGYRSVIYKSGTEHDPIPIFTAKLVDDLYLLDVNKQNHTPISPSISKQHASFMSALPHMSADNLHARLAHSAVHALSNVYKSDAQACIPVSSHATEGSAQVQREQPTQAVEPEPLRTPTPSNNNVSIGSEGAASEQATASAKLWHERLGHIAKSTLQFTCPTVHGIPSFTELSSVYSSPCEHCIAGRFPASHHDSLQHHPDRPLQIVYADLTGPYRTGWDGSKYTLNMVDGYSGYAYVTSIKNKECVHEALKEGINRLQSLSGHKLHELRTDQGSEFANSNVRELCGQYNILLTHSTPYTPQQNGVVERFNRSCMEICRSLLSHSKRSPGLWPDAYKTAAYLYNRRVSHRKYEQQDKTRYELFCGKQPNLSNLKVWGCRAYVKIPNDLQKSKLHARGTPCVFIGYDEFSTGYRVLVNRSSYVRGDVIFDENLLGSLQEPDVYDTPAEPAPKPAETAEEEADEQLADEVLTQTRSHTDPNDASVQEGLPPEVVVHKRQRRTHEPMSPALHTRSKTQQQVHATSVVSERDENKRKHPVFVPVTYECNAPTNVLLKCDATTTHCAYAHVYNPPHPHATIPIAETTPPSALPPFPKVISGQELPIPANLAEAMNDAFWPHWHKAVHEEYSSMQEMCVFELVDLPVGKHVLTSKWVFSWKMAHDVVVKAKARIVARGFQQVEHIDYSELFSPTVCQATLKMLLSHAASNNYYVHQLDVKTAFLNGELEEEIYMHPPDGCDDNTGRVWRLIKSLYGLKQAPRQWFKRLKSELQQLNFTVSDEDPALFYKIMPDGNKLFLCIHVDDMLIMHPTRQYVLEVVQQLSSIFEITDLGAASNYLKVDIVQLASGAIMLHQSTYAQACVHKYLDRNQHNMFGSTPLPHDFVFRKLNSDCAKSADECTPCDANIYRSIVGSLMYLSNFTRPDICHAVNQCCRYMHEPSKAHYKATQYILRYINSTHDYGIVYGPHTSPLTGFCDASHNSCPDTFRSCTGYCFILNNAAISWKSKMQSSVALSTAESEYMSICSSGKEAVWLGRLHADITSVHECVSVFAGEIVPSYHLNTTSKQLPALRAAERIYNDNQSAVKMVNNNHSSKMTKHIGKQHHWARERVEEGVLKYLHISGEKNMADIFTKFLPTPPFTKHRTSLGLHSYKEVIKQQQQQRQHK